MDEVIVVDDSSDASSMSEVATSTTPPMDTVPPYECAQSVGYADAVEAALAMAAALDVTEPSTHSNLTKKRTTLAPPLISSKIKRALNTKLHQIKVTQSTKDRTKRHRQRHRDRVSTENVPSQSESRRLFQAFDSTITSSSQDRPFFQSHSSVAKMKSCGLLEKGTHRDKRSSLSDQESNKRQRTGTRVSSENQSSSEIVELWSSSSSSSESYIRHRLYSSSPSSSDTEVVFRTPKNVGKKRLVEGSRIQENASIWDEQVEKTMRRRSLKYAKKQAMNKHEAISKCTHVLDKTSSVNRARPRDLQSLPPRNTCVSLLSSSSASSSPACSPVSVSSKGPALPSRTAPKEVAQLTNAVNPSNCHRSACTNSKPSVPPSAACVISWPSPSPRKRRRVTKASFNPDRMALTDLQAQERELARFQARRKQIQDASRIVEPAAPKQTSCKPLVLKDNDVIGSGTRKGKEVDANESQFEQSKAEVSVAAKQANSLNTGSPMLHPTSYRSVSFDNCPPNLLALSDQPCSAPFESNCDHPLTFYDETKTLASHCSILPNFGKPVQCLSSVFPSNAAKPQSEIIRLVNALVTAHVPRIRHCYHRKLRAILAEARTKVAAYQIALRKHKRTHQSHYGRCSHKLPRSSIEISAWKQFRAECSQSGEDIMFYMTRGNEAVQEISSFVHLNRVNGLQPLRNYTTSIGLRTNYRVEDNPIRRYVASVRPSDDCGENGGGEVAKKQVVRSGNIADEEVAEFVLRLVINRLGDSDQVFSALKSELDFAQAYTAYSELKKLHDSRERAKARLDQVEKLLCDKKAEQSHAITAMTNLMKKMSLGKANRALKWRLRPPISTFESNIAARLVTGATANVAALGLRVTNSYKELVDVFHDSFCRVCYMYACHEHSGDHPLPARRVDPIYPRVALTKHQALPVDCAQGLAAVDKDVVCLDSEEEKGVTVDDDTDDNFVKSRTKRRQPVDGDDVIDGCRHEREPMRDPSEYADASHVPLVATKMHSFLSTTSLCGPLCYKHTKVVKTRPLSSRLSASELSVLQKLRETIGENSCLLSTIVGTASCHAIHALLQKDHASDNCARGTESTSRIGHCARSWTQRRRSGGSNHELLQRTRHQRLQDRGTENHEYQPCGHAGMCDSTGCSCMKRDHMCEKACACSRDCPNRFEGCSCLPGECRTKTCPCFAALRECDPDVCTQCGASDMAVLAAIDPVIKRDKTLCGNVNVMRGSHKRLSMGFSPIHGYGMFAREAIASTEFVYEYTGAMLSQDEAERRGMIYDKMEMSYLFDLNEDAVLDALRCGNKSKFINHTSDTPNCTAKVVSVCGVHHITIWALRDIAIGEELVFDYGYKRSVGPDWSQH